MDKPLKNKVAIITGATGLLGTTYCRAMAEAGANVVVADINQTICDKAAAKLEGDALGLAFDVTDKASVMAAREKILKKYGRIDILVNNAALNEKVEDVSSSAIDASRFENMSLKDFKRALDVNVAGVFLCCQIFGAVMADKKSGSIVNIASTYGIVAPNQSLYADEQGKQMFYKSPAYSTTKSAVIGFTKYLAAYWGEKSVRVNALSPGGVENAQNEYFIKKYSEKTPLKRMAHPSDMTGALIFLAGDSAMYVTGANLVVDGGYTIW